MCKRANSIFICTVVFFVLLFGGAYAYGMNHNESITKYSQFNLPISGLESFIIIFILVTATVHCLWEMKLQEVFTGRIGGGVMWVLLVLFYMVIHAAFLWYKKGGIDFWQEANTGKIMVGILMLLMTALFVLAKDVIFGIEFVDIKNHIQDFAWRNFLIKVAARKVSPTKVVILVAFCILLILWVFANAFRGVEKSIEVIPPYYFLITYFIIGAIINVNIRREITGNIIIDAGIVSLGYLSFSLIFAVGFWMWLVNFRELLMVFLSVFIIAWLPLSFILRCLFGLNEQRIIKYCEDLYLFPERRVMAHMRPKLNPIEMPRYAIRKVFVDKRPFLHRYLLAMPVTIILPGIVILLVSIPVVLNSYMETGVLPQIADIKDIAAGLAEIKIVGSRIFLDVCMAVLLFVIIPQSRCPITPADEDSVFACIAKGFGYGTTCLCIVLAGVGLGQGIFAFPWFPLFLVVIFCGIISYGWMEATGNALLDSLIASMLLIGLAYLFSLGVFSAIQCQYMLPKMFPFWFFGSLTISLGIRVFHSITFAKKR